MSYLGVNDAAASAAGENSQGHQPICLQTCCERWDSHVNKDKNPCPLVGRRDRDASEERSTVEEDSARPVQCR